MTLSRSLLNCFCSRFVADRLVDLFSWWYFLKRGPIAFSISVWDGLQSTLGQWFIRYISVYLWLPVSDLFSCMLAKIQVLMLQNDIAELQEIPIIHWTIRTACTSFSC